MTEGYEDRRTEGREEDESSARNLVQAFAHCNKSTDEASTSVKDIQIS